MVLPLQEDVTSMANMIPTRHDQEGPNRRQVALGRVAVEAQAPNDAVDMKNTRVIEVWV